MERPPLVIGLAELLLTAVVRVIVGRASFALLAGLTPQHRGGSCGLGPDALRFGHRAHSRGVLSADDGTVNNCDVV